MQIKYLRDKDGNPYATFWTDGEKYGWSLCSKGDKFVKKVGVSLAEMRAKPHSFYWFEINVVPQSIRKHFYDWLVTEFKYFKLKSEKTTKHDNPNKYSKVVTRVPITRYLLMNGTRVVSTFFDEKEIDYVLNKLNG